MAAFTEGFSDSGSGEGKGGQHLGKVISMVLEARQLASDERKFAQKKLDEQDPGATLEDVGIEKGYFLKKALQHQFGGEFLDKRKNDLKKLILARRLLNSKKKLYVTTRNFLRNNTRFASVDSKRAASFRKKFNYKVEGVESPAGLEDTPKKVAKAASGGGRPKTKQDFLTAITEIAKSLKSTAESINNAVDQNTSIASGIVTSQKNIVVEISHRTDTVSDKLEAIAAAVNQQTEFLKKAEESAGIRATEKRSEGQGDGATTIAFDDLKTKKKDESEELSTSQKIEIQDQTTDMPPDPWGTAEKGAIIDGPKEGYNVSIGGVPIEAHGKELVKPIGNGRTAIVPLDNYATDGIQGNEVTPGGDLKAEKGMTLASMPTIPSLSGSQLVQGLSGLTSKTVKNISSTDTSSGQDMITAMELPFRAVGASLLKITGDVRNRLGAVSPSSDAKLNNIMNVVTNAFGLSSQDAAPTKSISEANVRVRTALAKSKDSDVKDDKWYDGIKNFVGDIVEKTGNMINSATNKVQDVVGGIWKWGKNQWNRFFGKKDENFDHEDIASMLVDEFKKQGLSETGAQLAAAELMRETGLRQDLILGSHDDGGVEAFGAGSWQGGREDGLFAHLESLGIKREDIASSGEKGIRGNASFLVKEIASRGGGNAELLELLKKPNLSKEEQDRVRKLFKDAYFVYHQDIPLSRSEDSFRYIMELLGVELNSSNLQSPSIKEAFTSNNILEELNLGTIELEPEISFINMGDTSFASNSAYTESLMSGSDTLHKGSDLALEIGTFYPRNLHG
tara:strand:- start:4806 stop:7178 length:2373 start_codon:yes stop_codon:yes gene_type:complete